MRRPWVRFDDPPLRRGDAGGDIERGFARRDFLEAHPGDRLLGARLRVAPSCGGSSR